MKKYFYSHLIDLNALEIELNSLELSADEKNELLDLAHDNIHHTVMDTILSHLEEDDKKKFLALLITGEHDNVWRHLNDKTDKIEEKIIEASEQIKKELTADVKKIK